MKYYSANGILGIGALFNGVFSDRSDGKTFDIKYRGINRTIKKQKSAVYTRRWKTEFTSIMKKTFLDEVIEKKPELKPNKINKLDYKYIDNTYQIKVNGIWYIAFYFMPLSMAGKTKSNFNPIPITNIEFDEYVPLDNRYMKDEMTNIMELYSSVDRKRYSTKLTVYGNRITSSNPFLTYFNINMDINNPGIKVYKKGSLAIQSYSSEESHNELDNSAFINLIKDTPYEEYLKGGTLRNAGNKKKNITNEYNKWGNFKTILGEGSIWYNSNDLIIDENIIKDENTVWIVDKPYNENNFEINIKMPNIINFLKSYMYTSSIYFTNDKAHSKFQPIISKLSIDL